VKDKIMLLENLADLKGQLSHWNISILCLDCQCAHSLPDVVWFYLPSWGLGMEYSHDTYWRL
jgi:hypothetical protein